MDHSQTQHMESTEAGNILDCLQTQQYLHPHQPLIAVLSAAARTAGFCPNAADDAVRQLHIDVRQSVGRFRQIELTELANHIYYFWQQVSPDEASVAI